MDVQIDPDCITTYRQDGVVCLRNVIDPHWLVSLRAGVEKSLRAPGPNTRHYNRDRAVGLYVTDSGIWRNIPEYYEFVRHSPAAAIAAQLMGATQVNIFCEDMFFKDAHTPEVTPWHHDMPYFPLEGDQVCSVWLALDEVPRENSVEYIAGSHRWGKQFRPRSFFNPEQGHEEHFPGEALEPIPNFESRRAELPIRSWDMAPGDVQVFHGFMVHGSPGNTTDHARRAFITRWCGDDVVYAWKGEATYPQFPGCTLEPGDPLDSETFPVIWRRDASI